MQVGKLGFYASGWLLFLGEVDKQSFEKLIRVARDMIGEECDLKPAKVIRDGAEDYRIYEIGNLTIDYLSNRGHLAAVISGEKDANAGFFPQLLDRMKN